MNRPFRLLSLLVLLSGLCLGSSITAVTILGGNWDGTAFTPNGLNWNNYDSNNWAVGVTAPVWGSPLLNPTGTLNIPAGPEYYLFMNGRDAFPGYGNALEITLGTNSRVFSLTGGSYALPGYVPVAGYGVSADAIVPPTDQDLVGKFQSYTPNGEADWVVGVQSVPEPGSMLLIGAGLVVLAASLRRKK